jgi:NadR type nicotinamide-nucleotide adenylyltransferase
VTPQSIVCRVCLTGAESTGKSALAQELARHFSAPWVPEYSRQYATLMNRELSFIDVSPIAKGQIELEDRTAESARDLLILDTDLLSTIVYSRHHFGACPEWIERLAKKRRADLYLLFDTGDARNELHDDFVRVLDQFGANYELIAGSWEERWRRAVEAIERARR